jgi:integrase
MTPQGLRGTVATMGREVGNTAQQVADMLGHASPAITEGGSYIDRERAAAAERSTALRVLAGGRL